MKNKSILIIIIATVLMNFVIASAEYSPLNPNYMGFDSASIDITVGDSFTTDIYVDVNSEIDTASVDNLTYLPAGILGYTQTTQGDLFGGSLVWMTPESNGEINNASGYAYPITWAHTVSVNNTNKTLATITWKALNCGVATLTITAGGTALGGVDPGTTFYTGTVNVHPQPITSFSATMHNTTQINLSWVKGIGDDSVLIRYSDVSNPTSPTDGTELYNGTGTSINHTGLNPGDHIYYSAWGYNATANLYSLTYSTADEQTNSPPVFGTPSPTNGETGTDISLTWSISITDPESDLIDWSIECSNGQSSSASSDTGGVKTISLSGLSYSTTYTVWVNATDAGSGTYTRDSFTFTTKANSPPNTPDGGSPGSPGDITPVNNAPDVPINVGYLRVIVTDPDGHSMTVRFYDGNNTLLGTDTNVASGETASISISTLNYNTTYYWYVEIEDEYGAITRGPTTGNWSYTTEEYTPGGGGQPIIYYHNVYITVVDATDNTPISNALIQVYKNYDEPNPILKVEGYTDEYGTWSYLLKKSEHLYGIKVSAPGYEEKTTTITIENDDIYLTINLNPVTVPPAGLMNEYGSLTQTGFLALIGAIFIILLLFYIWYDRWKK